VVLLQPPIDEEAVSAVFCPVIPPTSGAALAGELATNAESASAALDANTVILFRLLNIHASACH
jgi:hypothetical protein